MFDLYAAAARAARWVVEYYYETCAPTVAEVEAENAAYVMEVIGTLCDNPHTTWAQARKALFDAIDDPKVFVFCMQNC